MVEVLSEVFTYPPPGVLCASRSDDLPPRSTGVKDPDAKKKEWLQFRLQASNGFVALPNRLLDSKPFAALTTGASVKTLVWFWQMVEYHRGKRKKGAEPVIGRIDKITNNGELSFTYQEAEWRGIKQVRFRRALKDLHRLGFIDISRQGHGVKGEYTKYAISTRWQTYDTPDWQEIPFPKSFKEGFTSDEYIEKRKKESGKNSVQKRTLPAFNNERYEGDESPHSVQKRTLKTPLSVESQRSKTNVSIDLVMPTGSKKKVQGKVRTLNRRSKDAATPFRPTAIPTWPDQGKVQDLCDGLLLDALDRFGDDGQLHPEMDRARNLNKIINRAVGSRAVN